MIGAMLVGAWFLIHHQCCVQGEPRTESRIRSNMIDPLIRRSPLEKNFMRFGRSWTPPENQISDNLGNPPSKDSPNYIGHLESPSLPDILQRRRRGNDADEYVRLSKSKGNFMRFGRSGDFGDMERLDDLDRAVRSKENFMRFGRDNEDVMRLGRGKDNFMRFGRAKDNFMRFGRAKDNFMRFGRAKDNFMRFGRAKDNFMRFGRAKDNFMRFGRAKDNFMRFGKSNAVGFFPPVTESSLIDYKFLNEELVNDDGGHVKGELEENEIPQSSGKSGEGYKLWGLNSVDDDEFLRLAREVEKSGFIRFGRDKPLIRYGRHRQSDKGDGFIRFGRSMKDNQTLPTDWEGKKNFAKETDEKEEEKDLNEQPIMDERASNNDESGINVESDECKQLEWNPFDAEVRNNPENREMKRFVRSVKPTVKAKTENCKEDVTGPSSYRIMLNNPTSFYSGVPNFLAGPEFSLLPNLKLKTKRTNAGSKNFIRLG